MQSTGLSKKTRNADKGNEVHIGQVRRDVQGRLTGVIQLPARVWDQNSQVRTAEQPNYS